MDLVSFPLLIRFWYGAGVETQLSERKRGDPAIVSLRLGRKVVKKCEREGDRRGKRGEIDRERENKK